MKLSKAFFASLRENPRDADIVSQQLFMRGNLIRKHGAGIFSYLPMLVRSYHKLCAIVREELDNVGWQEVIMPYVIPAELWKETGRWDLYEGVMLKFKDRKQNEFCTAPTAEEVATDLVRSQVNSYKQLPLTLYQITPKFRDEIRPRFGLMRGREFVMMDGYSFHTDRADLDRHYDEVAGAYKRIFQRSGLRFVKVEADTGAIGGTGSHEFQVLAEAGEDHILACTKCEYAANIEKAETPLPEKQKRDWGSAATKPFEKVSTPTQKTIDEVSAFLKVPTHRNIKTLVYRFNTAAKPGDYKAVVAFVLGHRQLNEVKLGAQLGKIGVKNLLELSAMPEDDVAKLFNSPVGFLGPIGAPAGAMTLFDRELFGSHDLVCGANEAGFHLQHLEPKRDLTGIKDDRIADLVNAEPGEPCPRCSDGVYQSFRGIEVGHIFKLGDKYSKAMNAAFQNDKKQNQIIEMGTYGIGVSRILAATIEQNHDADGMIWTESLAPYQVHVVSLASGDAEVERVANAFYESLKKAGIEALLDDRDLSPGVKFKDQDLIGIPRRITIGKKGIELGEIEFSLRSKPKEKRSLKVDFKDQASIDRVCKEIRTLG
jgi:prolyl-tRNA synthetase